MFTGEVIQDTGVSQHVKQAVSSSFERIKQEGDVHTDLCKIMRKAKSDKGFGPYGKHNYTQFYNDVFEPRRESIERFLEIGLGTNNVDVPSNMGPGGTPGASLRGWRSYFEQARVFGGDVDRRILFEEDRISTFFIDQMDCEIIERALADLPAADFDVILDDGLHRYQANINLHGIAKDHVKPGGYYIIEDIHGSDLNVGLFCKYLADIKNPSILINLPHQRVIPDNVLALIEY